MRPSKDEWFQGMAKLVARRSTCVRLAVGCVLVDTRGHVLSTGYNGRAAGLPHCAEAVEELGPERPTSNPFWREQGGRATERPILAVYPHRCPRSDAPPGEPSGCEAVHAEQNALLQCSDVYRIEAAHVTIAPCLTCVKMLLNTSCRRIVFGTAYAYPDAARLWREAGRLWQPMKAEPPEGTL